MKKYLSRLYRDKNKWKIYKQAGDSTSSHHTTQHQIRSHQTQTHIETQTHTHSHTPHQLITSFRSG